MIRLATALAAAVSLAAFASASAQTPTMPANEAMAAETPADWGTFGIQTQFVDPTVKPGDDFDGYVNGKWLKTFQIPADRTTVGSFVLLDDLSEQRVHAILDQMVAANPAQGTAQAKIATAYTAFMDTSAIEARGLAPVKPYLARIATAKSTDDLITLFADPAFASPIGTGVGVDAKDSNRYIYSIAQSALGLPDRDYYLVDSLRNTEIRAKYLDYLTFMLGKAGFADARGTAGTVYDLEKKMAAAMWDRALSRNRDLTYNKLSVAELGAMAPQFPFAALMQRLGAGAVQNVVVRQIPPTPAELAGAKYTPEMAAKLGGGVPATMNLVTAEPIDSWKAWLAAKTMASAAPVLPREIDDANFAFYGKFLQGQPQQRARWKRGIDAVEDQVGELLGKVYAQQYFPEANKLAMTDLVANLRKAMGTNLTQLKWMGVATRKEAQAKLDAFTPKIGAPDEYKTYAGLAITSDPLANTIAANKWQSDYDLARIDQPVDRKEWGMSPQTVNAYYNPSLNEIVFPAAILQPPFFNVSADPAVNYGGIGAVIGHEMGHGFDDQGAKSDGLGNLRNWWTDADRAAFDALTSRLGAQYDKLCPFDEGKTCIKGSLTMGENIGDLGGLSLAYRAYKLSLHGKKAPVIGGFTGDQRFFMGWAQVWRGKVREERARQLLLTDPHSPPHYRINAVVRNFDEWHKAFGVKPGDALYLAPKDRVRIW